MLSEFREIDVQKIVPPEALVFACLSADLPKGLLVGSWCGRADFLICRNSTAVSLSGETRFLPFREEGINDSWYGYHVSDVWLKVDLASAFTDRDRDARPGDLVVQNGGVYVATRSWESSRPQEFALWGDATPLSLGRIVGGFSIWQIVHGTDENAVVLLEVDSAAQQ